MDKELYDLLNTTAKKLCERAIEESKQPSGYVDLPRLVEATTSLIKELK